MGYPSPAKTVSITILTLLAMMTAAHANGIGQVKNVQGAVFIEKNNNKTPLKTGDALQQADVIHTGGDGSVGIVFIDNSTMAVGPDTVLALDKFEFNSTTHAGVFNSSLRQGTLAVKSGKIVKQTPEAMKINTRTSVLAVRGTEFVVSSGN
ncbi:MAG: FecR domain-containing protein [Magnetococcus sp. DMHC-1]|nr:FecR domain-containing protein [Magnetococcales bacterium]